MAQQQGFFGNATDVRTYTQISMQRFVMDYRRNGYVSGVGSALAVVQHSTGDMSVDVGSGECWIQGCHHADGSAVNLEIADAHATLGRIDRVVMRNTIVGTRKIEPVVITGTAASSPVAPDYVRTSDTYDLVIADITVGAGVTQILTANITDRRANTTYCGKASPLWVRITDSIPGDDFDANSQIITGSADPVNNTDAVTLGYANSYGRPRPPGSWIKFTGSIPPTGYLAVNGQAINQTLYPVLYSLYGANLPDAGGMALVGYDSTDSNFNAVLKTGGEKTHALTEAEMFAHEHGTIVTAATDTSNGPADDGAGGGYIGLVASHTLGSAGSGTAHSNLQKYITALIIVKGE